MDMLRKARKAWLKLALIGCCIAGCSGDVVPPTLPAVQRDAMKANLVKLGARVTSDEPEGIYLSLRNTHTQIRESAAMIEVELRTRQDVTDFTSANQAIAGSLGDAAKTAEFTQWVRNAISSSAPPVSRSEYDTFKVTLSRNPLRSLFTAKQPAGPE